MDPLKTHTAVLTHMNTLYYITHMHIECRHIHTYKYTRSPGISLMKTGLQIDSHGRREHLELISLRCFDTSLRR